MELRAVTEPPVDGGGVTSDPMSAEDAALLYAEAPGTQLQIGALCFFEAAPLRDRRGRLRLTALRSHVEARLAGLARFRQRIMRVPGDLAAPRWVDDEAFDVSRHTPHVRLPGEGGHDELERFLGGLLARPMDLDHPLWDLHFVEGDLRAPDASGEPVEAVAVVLRAHHVMADGLALHAASTLLLDAAPRPYQRRPRPWSPRPAPGAAELTLTALTDRARRQVTAVAGLTMELADPRHLADRARAAGRMVWSLPQAGSALAPPTSWNAPVGHERGFTWSTLPMADLLRVKRACDATLNDVVLAATTGAVRRSLGSPGRRWRGREPRALIPIGGPAGGSSGGAALGNRFSFTEVALPTRVDDPLERVRVLHQRMHAPPAERPGRNLVPYLFSVTDLVPPPLLRAVIPRVLAHQPLVNLAVSNVPGSRAPLWLWDSRLLGLHPFIDVVGNVAVIVGVLSYVDTLGVGVTVDPSVVGDPAVVNDHLRDATDELVRALD